MGRPGRRKVNRGWFRQGFDPRRHQFTPEERSRGGKVAFAYLMDKKPWVLLGLRKKLRASRRRREGPGNTA